MYAAHTYKREHKGFSTTIIKCENFSSVENILEKVKKKKSITRLVYFGHSYSPSESSDGYGGLSIFYGEAYKFEWLDQSTSWKGVKFTKHAKAYLYGCNCGTGGSKSIAQAIANKTGMRVFGYACDTFATTDEKLAKFKRKPVDADVNSIVQCKNGDDLWFVPSDVVKSSCY